MQMVKNGFSNMVDSWWLSVSKVYSMHFILGRRLGSQNYKVFLAAFTVNINFNVHSFCGGYINKIFLCSKQICTEHLYMDLYWSIINTSSLYKYVICNLSQIYGPEEGNLYPGFLTSKPAIPSGSVQDRSPLPFPQLWLASPCNLLTQLTPFLFPDTSASIWI